MNLAYAKHEIISDYTTAAFLWFESWCAGGPGLGRTVGAPSLRRCACPATLL